MIVIGADTHKGSHALAAVDEGAGRVRGSREIKADDAGHPAAVRWARGLDAERVWAIEDSGSSRPRAGSRARRTGHDRVGRVRAEARLAERQVRQLVAMEATGVGLECLPVRRSAGSPCGCGGHANTVATSSLSARSRDPAWRNRAVRGRTVMTEARASSSCGGGCGAGQCGRSRCWASVRAAAARAAAARGRVRALGASGPPVCGGGAWLPGWCWWRRSGPQCSPSGCRRR